MKNIVGRALASIAVLGAGVMLTACVPQAAPQGQTPAVAPVTVTVSPQQGKDPGSAGQNGKKTEPKPAEQKPAGPQFDQSVFVTSFDPATRKTLVIVQRPKEFVPSHVTGHGAAEIKLTDMHWATWDRNEARGNCSAYVTGGGADPETIKGVRVIFGKAQYKDGKVQYTHYRLEFPDGTVNDRDLEFNVD